MTLDEIDIGWWVARTVVSPTSHCRIWSGRWVDADGYGIVRVDGRLWRAHRLALLLAEGPPPPGRPLALHKCATPSCVNPQHLYFGDARQNAADRQRDRRARRALRFGVQMELFAA